MIGAALASPEGPPAFLDELDPRVRIVAVGAVAVTAVSMPEIGRLLTLFAGVILLAAAFRISWRATLKRMAVMDAFMVVLLLMLPFTVPGTPFVHVGPWPASWEGLWRAVGIILKANCVVLTVLALLGAMESVRIGQALASLGLSEKLVHMFLFTVRYIDLLHGEYRRLRRALQARAFVAGGNWHTWRTLGWLMGMLLVRSFDRSERILLAMKCRGFSGRFYLHYAFQLRRGDYLFAGVIAAVLLGVRFWEPSL